MKTLQENKIVQPSCLGLTMLKIRRKMGKCTFQKLWTYNDNYKDWLFVGGDEHTGFCKACKRTFDISNMGESAVKSHMKGKKHLENLFLLQQMQSRQMSPSEEFGSSSEISIPVNVTLEEGPNGTHGNMPYLEVLHLNRQLEERDKQINTLKVEVRLLQLKIVTKDREVLELARENEHLNKLLAESRERIEYLESTQVRGSGVSITDISAHLEALRNSDLESKAKDLSLELKESESLADDLHLKLGRVLGTLKALGTSLAAVFPIQVPQQKCIAGPSNDKLIPSIEAGSNKTLPVAEITVDTDQLPNTSLQVLAAHLDVSSSSSTDVRDSPEGNLESLPPKKKIMTAFPTAGIQHENLQEGNELTCVICQLKFKITEEQELLTAEEKEMFKCATCMDLEQEQRPLMGSTDSSPRSNKTFKCTICNKAFHYPSKLKNHLRTHTGEKPFHCNVCGKSFSLSFNLKIHYRTHSGERPFMCQVCGKNFRQSKSLLYHHCTFNLRKGLLTCKICNNAYEPNSFRSHKCVPTDGNQNPYPCDFCGKSFRSPGSLAAHKLTHGEKGAHACDVCGEAFSLPSDLKSHWCAGTYKQTDDQSISSADSTYLSVNSSSSSESSLLKHHLIQGTAFPGKPKSYGVPVIPPASNPSTSSAEQLGTKQVSEIYSSKSLSDNSVKEVQAETSSGDPMKQEPEFYDLSELAHLKSYSDSTGR